MHLVRAATAYTALGSRHQPSTGVTAKLLGGSHSAGSAAEHVDAGRVEPGLLLGLAQRGLHGGLAGVDRPPGKETWPGCERMSWARSVSSRSGPAPSPKSISTAPRRRARPGGGMNRVRSWPVIERGGVRDRPQPVRESQYGAHRSPRGARSTRSTSSSAESTPPASTWRRRRPRRRRASAARGSPANVAGTLQIAARVGEQRVGDTALPGQRRARAPGTVLVVDADDRRPGRRTARGRPGGPASPRGTGRTRRPEVDTIGPSRRRPGRRGPPPRQGRVTSGSAPPPGRRARSPRCRPRP